MDKAGLFWRVRRAVAAGLLLSAVGVSVGVGGSVAGATGPLTIHSIRPVRLLDTRSGNGAPAVKVGPGQKITVQITGREGLPTSGVSAVSVNFTVTAPTVATYVTAWPAGEARPTASTLNAAAGQTIANSTIVKLSPSGQIDIYNSSGSTHVLADVNGWFPTGSDFTGVTPVRVLDTRSGLGAPAVKVGPGQSITLQIAGRGGVPSSGVSAVSVNFTVTGPSLSTFLTAWPAGEARPTASTLNLAARQTVANSTIVKLSAAGSISIYNYSGSAHVIADVNGWFLTGSDFTGVTPVRLLDTRSGNGAPAAKVGPGQTITLQITGRNGIPATGVAAVSVNFTVTAPTTSTFVTAWPEGRSRPLASTLNAVSGQTIANSTIVKLSASGQISIYNNSGSAHVIADIGGWFPPQGVEQLDMTAYHTCAVLSDTSVKCWGTGVDGQLGDPGIFVSSPMPVDVRGLFEATQVAVGRYHSCALRSDGTVRCWGSNYYGQLGAGADADDSAIPLTVSGISNATQIAAGESSTCALIDDGTVKCWGANGQGQLGDGSLLVRPTPVSVFQLSNAVKIAAGARHMCAILETGEARCWGDNADFQIGDGTTTNRTVPATPTDLTTGTRVVTSISGGLSHTCAVTYDPAASPLVRVLRWCWGKNPSGEFGDGSIIESSVPRISIGSSLATDVSAGEDHTCWLSGTDEVRCSGDNTEGSLGDGTGTNSLSLTTVSGISNAVQIDSGSVGFSSCAVLSDATAWCWGNNQGYQLGDGTLTNRLSPVRVAGL